MPTNKIKLTTTAVDKLRAAGIYWDTQTPGLGVRVSESGTKTYFYKRRVKGTGKERNIKLARHGDPMLDGGKLRTFPFGADDARAKAAAIQAQLLAGVDPVAEDQRKRGEAEAQAALNKAQSMTLREAMLDYFEHRSLRPATKHDYQRFTERHLTTWLDEPVAQITRDRVLAKVVELEQRSAVQAHKMTVYLSIFLNHAREKFATDDGSYPLLAVNPVKRMRQLKKNLRPPEPSDTRIPLPKVGSCWSWLRKRSANARTENERTAADWLSFIMLTGCRRLESGSLKWSDVDLDAKTITLRADVVKNKRKLVLPMSAAMHELLSARKNPPPLPDNVARRRLIERRSDEYVFATNGKKCPHITNAQATVEALSKIAGKHTHVHALRRTFDDVAMECKIDGDLRRLLLNHKNGDVHARHYSNGARALTDAVESIAQWITNAAAVAEAQECGANVVSLSERKAGKTA